MEPKNISTEDNINSENIVAENTSSKMLENSKFFNCEFDEWHSDANTF